MNSICSDLFYWCCVHLYTCNLRFIVQNIHLFTIITSAIIPLDDIIRVLCLKVLLNRFGCKPTSFHSIISTAWRCAYAMCIHHVGPDGPYLMFRRFFRVGGGVEHGTPSHVSRSYVCNFVFVHFIIKCIQNKNLCYSATRCYILQYSHKLMNKLCSSRSRWTRTRASQTSQCWLLHIYHFIKTRTKVLAYIIIVQCTHCLYSVV